MTALPAFQIVGGIDGTALGAGIVLEHFRVPGFVACFLDAGLRFPQFDPVRRQRLKFFQVTAGIFRAASTEIQAFSRRAFCHGALRLAIKAPFFGPASVAPHFLKGPLKALGHHHELCRLFVGPDEYVARGAKQPANCGKVLVRYANIFLRIVHEHCPSFHHYRSTDSQSP
jgi:hypothetical protein